MCLRVARTLLSNCFCPSAPLRVFNGPMVAPLMPPEFRRLLDWLAACPKLDGALCRGHADVFDSDTPPGPAANVDRFAGLCTRVPRLWNEVVDYACR